MAASDVIAPGTSIDVGRNLQIIDAEVERIGSWLIYAAVSGGKPFRVYEYFPLDIARRGEGGVPECAHDGDNAARAWSLARDRFKRLAQQLTSINSKVPGIVEITQAASDGLMLLAGPRKDGDESVAEALVQGERFSPLGVMTLAGQLAATLTFVHAQDLLHLDIRPETVVLRDDQAVLIGFSPDQRQFMAVLGGKDTLVHPPYSPIELYDSQGRDSLTPSTDIYAASALLFELITGDKPPEWQQRLTGDTPAARPVAKGYPPVFLDAIGRGLTTDPKTAFVTVDDWHEAMGRPSAMLGPAGWFESQAGSRPPWGWIAAAAAAAVVAMAGGGALLYNHFHPQKDEVAIGPAVPPDPVVSPDAGSAAATTPASPPAATSPAPGKALAAAPAAPIDASPSASGPPTPEPTPKPKPVVPTPPPPPRLTLETTAGTWRVGSGKCDHTIGVAAPGRMNLKIGGETYPHDLVATPKDQRKGLSWTSKIHGGDFDGASFRWSLKGENELTQQQFDPTKPARQWPAETWRRCGDRGR